MLDLSAAFDVIDHNILLNRLDYAFGISGDVFSWIKSYLVDRTQRVILVCHLHNYDTTFHDACKSLPLVLQTCNTASGQIFAAHHT
jgi:hypothetical protein